MPLEKYYNGSGKKVMSKMKQEYGNKKGEQVFYATANARKSKGKPKRNNSRGFGFGKPA